MLKVLRADTAGALVAPAALSGWRIPADAIWIDLVSPTREEEHLVEESLGLLLPTREDMAEIEFSSRLYHEDGASVMTALILCDRQSGPASEPITFAISGSRLVTIRYAEPKSFTLFAAQAERQLFPTGVQVFMGLLETVVDRTADVLEHSGTDIEAASAAIFYGRRRTMSFRGILDSLGRAQHLNARVRMSLSTLARLCSFASLAPELEADKDARVRMKSVTRDVASIADHAAYLSANTTFLLDAALGQINIEQNDIIKIFSVAAVAFLPPTLIASIYGMNFEHMPELKWMFGYPAALVAMVISAIGPLLYFRRKGWM